MPTPYKLHIKLGDAEFTAEGSEDAVREQFESFKALITGRSSAGGSSRKLDDSGTLDPPGPVPREKLLRLFSVTEDKAAVSLRILPRTENRENRDADALLLLLYGFRALAEITEVLSGRLMNAATVSGLQLERIDRVILTHRQYITEGGARRGKTYGLNNQGINRAVELIGELGI